MTDLVNAHQGFRLKGWFKPSVAENGVTQETFSVHVCYLALNGTMTDDQKNLMNKNGKFR